MATARVSAKDVISGLRDLSGNVVWRKACDTLSGLANDDWQISVPIPDLPAPPGTSPPPGPSTPALDVVKALEEIAQAINKAGSVLDQQDMIVSSGTVAIDINVLVPGTTVGAQTHFELHVGPKPFS